MRQIFKMSKQRAVLYLLPLLMGLLASAAKSRAEVLLESGGWINSLYNSMPYDAIGVRQYDYWQIEDGAPSQELYLCRAYHENDVQPGYTSKGENVCHFSYGGQELTSTNYDWWTPTWVSGLGQPTPPNAIALGGNGPAGGNQYLYGCRAGKTPGQYADAAGGCTYPYAGVENSLTENFQWLVDPGGNVTVPGRLPGDYVAYDSVFGPYRTEQPFVPDYFPPDAIVAGKDLNGQLLYECIVPYGDGYQVGKTRQDWGACDIGWGGAEIYLAPEEPAPYVVLVPNFQVATNVFAGVNCPYGIGTCSLLPIPVGRDTDGATLYSCYMDSGNGPIYPGKTRADWNSCSYAVNGVEVYASGPNPQGYGFRILSDGLIYPIGYQPPH
jgi:hypothetical protein